jgi:hypothetical protein
VLPDRREWSTDAPDLKCNVPCKPCNEGWMAQLEDRAKPALVPLIRGRPTRLEPHRLELISFWALKTTFMLDRCSDAEHQNVPPTEFRQLYQKR